MNYRFQFDQIAGDIPYILGGAVTTLWLSFASFFLGLALGLVLAVAETSGGPWARGLARLWTGLFTNAPLFVILFYLFNGLPELGLLLSPAQSGLIAFTLTASGYLAQIQRGGLQSVRRTELDAAETLGMSRRQTLRFVILPHVLRTVYPPMAGFFIILMLGTSMTSLVGLDEMTGRAIEVSSRNFRTIEVFSVLALAYVALTLLSSLSLALIGRHVFRARMGSL